MKYTLIIISALSISFANIKCMENNLLLEDAVENTAHTPPPYSEVSATASAPGYEMTALAPAVPQGTDSYMTYQEWWNKNNIPTEIREKNVREQAEWFTEKQDEDHAALEKKIAQEKKNAWTHGELRGAILAGVLCCILHG